MSNRTEIHDRIQLLTTQIANTNNFLRDKENISSLDTDLLRKQVIDMYEELLKLQAVPANVKNTPPTLPVEPKFTPPVTTPAAEEIKPPVEEVTAPEPKPEPKPEPQPEFKTPEPIAPVIEPVKTVEPEPVKEPEPVSIPQVEKPEVPQMETVRMVEKTVVQERVVEAVKKDHSLNDLLKQEERNDLASRHQQTPIHDLKKAISINKKFEFINQLFKGDHEAYTKAIHTINSMDGREEAAGFFNTLKTQYQWKEDDKIYLELADMVRRRFM